MFCFVCFVVVLRCDMLCFLVCWWCGVVLLCVLCLRCMLMFVLMCFVCWWCVCLFGCVVAFVVCFVFCGLCCCLYRLVSFAGGLCVFVDLLLCYVLFVFCSVPCLFLVNWWFAVFGVGVSDVCCCVSFVLKLVV